jgi:hypothetical protein
MFKKFIKNLKNLHITFKFSLQTLFVLLFSIALLSLIAITYYSFSKIILLTSFEHMKDISSLVSEKVASQINASINLTKYTARLIESDTINYKNLNDMLKNMDHLIMSGAANIESVQSAIWADEHGNFVVSHKPADNGRRTLEIIDRSQIPISRTVITHFADGSTTKQFLTQNITVDQRTRP